MKLYKIIYINDLLDEEVKELIFKSDNLSVLESYAERYAQDFNREKSDYEPQWNLLGVPTMCDNKLNRESKKSLQVSEQEFLLISVV